MKIKLKKLITSRSQIQINKRTKRKAIKNLTRQDKKKTQKNKVEIKNDEKTPKTTRNKVNLEDNKKKKKRLPGAKI